jgi:hypothetical protein
MMRRTRSEGGGGPPTAGSKIWCSIALQPYIWDSLHAVAVPLPPDRYALEAIEEHVHAAPDGAGWIARGESTMGLQFRYRVTDRATGLQVLENSATLACADRPAQAARSAPPPAHDTPPGSAPYGPWDVKLPTPLTRFQADWELGGGGVVWAPRTGALYGIGTFSMSLAFRHLYVPLHFDFGQMGDNSVLGFSLGAGARLPLTPSVDLHIAPVIRGMSPLGIDVGAVLGLNVHLYNPRRDWGWTMFFDTSGPIARDSFWTMTLGFGFSLGSR